MTYKKLIHDPLIHFASRNTRDERVIKDFDIILKNIKQTLLWFNFNFLNNFLNNYGG